MAKHIYQIGFDTIKKIILKNKSSIIKYITDDKQHQISKIFGKSYYEIAIYDFFKLYSIDKDISYSLQILNIFKKNDFIENLYLYLDLDIFKHNKIEKKDIFYSIFYCIYKNDNIFYNQNKYNIFSNYFLHYLQSIKKKTNTVINYQNMTLSYIKNKNITLQESYQIDNEKVSFSILINDILIIKLYGTSIKTLRKKAYKKIFYYLIDNKKFS